MCDTGMSRERLGAALAPLQSCWGAWGRGARAWGASFSPPVKGEGDTPCISPGRGTLRSGLGGALGSCEGQGLEQGLGNALFNGLRVLSLETSVGNADPGFLCLASVIYEA